jgi:uncharacterized protein
METPNEQKGARLTNTLLFLRPVGDNSPVPHDISMIAHIYKSLRKPDAYVYLRDKDAFGLIPDTVRAPLGDLAFVMSLDLREDRKLARADVKVVRLNLTERGFYLQVPPSVLDPLVAGGVGDG